MLHADLLVYFYFIWLRTKRLFENLRTVSKCDSDSNYEVSLQNFSKCDDLKKKHTQKKPLHFTLLVWFMMQLSSL